MNRIVLAATDGSPASLGALRCARELEAVHGFRVEVLGVVEPVPVFDAGFLVALPEVELYESRRDALRHEIETLMGKISGTGGEWAVWVEGGVPGPRIVKRAEELGAGLVVMGLGRHGPMDRVFGTETALQVLRVSRLPVLAVPENFSGLPGSAALGMDFSSFSLQAARDALRILRPPWEVHLVHVMSGLEFLPAVSQEWRADYEGELQERLAAAAGELPRPEGCVLHTHVLEGEPARELMAFARERGLEMLVAGSHGHSFMGRLLTGSVSTRLIRGARLPVLVVPPQDPPQEALGRGPSRGGAAHPWVEELKAFTRLNAGRRTTLEIHDPESGAQVCGKDLPLRGVNYDPGRDRVDIMLGRTGTVEGHLTHSLQSPREIQVAPGPEGRPEALYVRLPQGQAVLRVHRD